MQIDALAVRLRPRSAMEAADLGVRLCQSRARAVYTCHAAVAIPVIAAAAASYEIASWLPSILVWLAKPWLDRTILFVLARAAFGQSTSPRDVWREQRQVWWRHWIVSVTLQRVSLWRSLTQPVYQLEGLSFSGARARVRQIRHGKAGSALLVTAAFSAAESALTLSLISLVFWFAPAELAPSFGDLVSGEMSAFFSTVSVVAYGLAVLFLEPFYVAGGFGMYLTRRAELEAWDLEQEFRRAFAA